MNRWRIPLALIWMALAAAPAAAAEPAATPFQVQRLSPRVLVLTEGSDMRNNLVVLVSQRGLVLVDTTGSPRSAAQARQAVRRELGRDDIAWVINTHHHWDHVQGNQEFADALIVGYEGCVEPIRQSGVNVARQITELNRNIEVAQAELARQDKESEAAAELKRRITRMQQVVDGFQAGYVATPPRLTFNNRLTLDLGDLTLRLVFFGRAHSGTDIFIQVPEEGLLLTGDVFLDEGWLPLFAGQAVLDVPRWIEVLNDCLDGSVRQVIPGHKSLWTPAKLALWRDYIILHWQVLHDADAAGLSFQEVQARCPVPADLDYLKALGHDDSRIAAFHQRNLQAFWSQIKPSAAAAIQEELERNGIEAARARFVAMRSDVRHTYFIEEARFNTLGYQLLGQGKSDAAVAVFEMNVTAFPDSWNAYDSLGEALMSTGQREAAIVNYRKSLELNPGNDNARRMLQRMGVDAGPPTRSDRLPPPPPRG